MKTLYTNGLVYHHHQLKQMDFIVQDKKWMHIASSIDRSDMDKIVDLKGLKVIPGLFDIHTHGALGFDFNMATLDEMKLIMNYYMSHGVTSVLPTVMTDDIEVIRRQLKLMASLKPLYPIMKGIHLEGPFLSVKYKGAQPESAILKPSVSLFKQLMEDSNHLIKYTTLAPEIEGALELIDYCQSVGVRVTLGHSNATFAETERAIKHGASSFTHMFNAMRPFDHHEPGIVGAALMSNCYTEMILDGKHLDPHTVLFLKKMRGLNRLLIVTDSIMATGLEDGNYQLAGTPIYVKDGDARLVSNDARAGSTLNAFQAIKNFSKYTKTRLERSSLLMSLNPAKLMGMDDHIGSIDVGKDADFIVLEHDEIQSVYSQGNKVYEKE